MSEVNLRDILEAEKQAQEKVRVAGEQAEKIRAEAAAEAARTEADAAARIENLRRELLEKAEREAAEITESTLRSAEAEMQGWEEQCRRSQDALLDTVCRILKGERA